MKLLNGSRRVLLAALFSLTATMTYAAPDKAPVAKLVEPTGDVQYSVSGTSWKSAPRIKYLFDGYQVRTGKGGAVRLLTR